MTLDNSRLVRDEMCGNNKFSGSVISIPLIFLLLSAGMLILAGPAVADSHMKHAKINCDIQNGSCTQKVEGRTITLEVLPKPVKAMEDLQFKLSIDGAAIEGKPYIDLNMPAMDMGKNRVDLKRDNSGEYQGQGVIVRCRSGHRTWQANAVIPGVGEAKFIFEVIY